MTNHALNAKFYEPEKSGSDDFASRKNSNNPLMHLEEILQRKESPAPTTLARGSQVSEVSGPGAFFSQPRGGPLNAEFTGLHRTEVTQANEPQSQPIPPTTFAVEGELVASPVEESQPNEPVGEVYKAEPIESNSHRKYGMMKWALIFLAFAVTFVAAALLFRSGDNPSPSRHGPPNDFPDFSEHAVFTQHLVFLGTAIPSTCNTSDISITITCESDDAILFLDKANPISHNMMRPWVFTRRQQARCTQAENNQLSYVSFTCAWMGNETSPAVSVQMNEIQVGCVGGGSVSPVSAGVSLGRLCPGRAKDVEYNNSATTCPGTPSGGGCVAQQRCSFCAMPSWEISEPLEDHDSCQASSWNSTIMSDVQSYPNALEELDTIVESNRQFYNITTD